VQGTTHRRLSIESDMKLLSLKMCLTCLVVLAFSLPFIYPQYGSGFLEELEMLGVGGAVALFAVFLVFVYFYCRDLSRTLALVSPERRAAAPGSVWLMFLIPYNFVEDFFIVHNVARSIEREAAANPQLNDLRGNGLFSGIGWCVAQIVSLAPGMIGKTASLIAIILWAVHWRFVRQVNTRLASAPGRERPTDASAVPSQLLP